MRADLHTQLLLMVALFRSVLSVFALSGQGSASHGTPLGQNEYRPRSPVRRTHAAPTLLIGNGLELDIFEAGRAGATLAKRAANGSVIFLGEDLTTFIVPVNIGTPPITYPLQLDLGSSDLLLASTLCGSRCPQSQGPVENPYYDVSVASSTFRAIQGNTTAWSSSFADGSTASGFVAEEQVTLGKDVALDPQVLGLINSTNLTLATQKISGILGLGFPRLSTLTHAVFGAADNRSSGPYYPPLLENLVTSPIIRYPVFGLALSPPANATSNSGSSDSSSTARYQPAIGSLTIGGVSSQYVSSDTSAPNAVDQIEWHDIVPFGRALAGPNETAVEVTGTSFQGKAAMSTSSTTASSFSNGSTIPSRRHASRAFPADLHQLGGEEYLYWAINLGNISVNGTTIAPTSTYASIGLQSVALMDAGTNGIYGPQQDVEAIFRLVPDARQSSAGQWIVPCNTKMTIGFSFGGRYVQLDPSDWIFAGITDSEFCLAWPVATPSTGDGIDWQLGTPFLRKIYSIFSYGINGVQAPMIGLLPITNSSLASTDGSQSPTPTAVSPLVLTTTLAIAIPNALLPDPSYTTPSYVFSAEPTLLTPGFLQTIGLANASAYTVSQVPIIDPPTNTSSLVYMPTSGYGGGGNSVQPTSSGIVQHSRSSAVLFVLILTHITIAMKSVSNS